MYEEGQITSINNYIAVQDIFSVHYLYLVKLSNNIQSRTIYIRVVLFVTKYKIYYIGFAYTDPCRLYAAFDSAMLQLWNWTTISLKGKKVFFV